MVAKKEVDVAIAQFKIVHPVLPARDLSQAVNYDTEKLGFRLLFQDKEDEAKYAGVARDEVELHIQWHAAADFAAVEKLVLRFVIDDVDERFEEYRDKGVFHAKTALQNTRGGRANLPSLT